MMARLSYSAVEYLLVGRQVETAPEPEIEIDAALNQTPSPK